MSPAPSTIRRATLETCAEGQGTVAVIDVLRACTTACYAFLAGASEIVLASTVDEAFALRERYPEALTMGEVEGYPIEGFDLGNSPWRLAEHDLRGRRLIHRTTAGTQGAVRAAGARRLLGACLCNLSATVAALRAAPPDEITLLTTGIFPGGWGDEDAACADCIEALLAGRRLDLASVEARVRASRSGLHFSDPASAAFPPQDIDLALAVDRFPYTLEITRERDLLVMRPGG